MINISSPNHLPKNLNTISENSIMQYQSLRQYRDCWCDIIALFKDHGLDPDTECIHPQDDSREDQDEYSEFPNPSGKRVRFNQEEEIISPSCFETCCVCNDIQDDNILFECCQSHYLCSECFYQEKSKSQRQNAEYQLQQRRGNPCERYQFSCPECSTIQKLDFNLSASDFIINDDEIIYITAFKSQ